MRAVVAVVEQVFGVGPVASEDLAGDLGTRRFLRVTLPDRTPSTCVARIEAPEDPAGRPAGVPPEPHLEPLRSLLEAAGLPVPQRYGGSSSQGIELLEDLGDLSLRAALSQASDSQRDALYAEAWGLIAKLQAVTDPKGQTPAFERHLDGRLIAYKRDLFLEWSVPRGLARDPSPGERNAVKAAFDAVARAVAAAPLRLAHRDYQSRNLFLAKTPGGGRRLVMIDFQGAFLAPPEYDLVCLLRDSSSPLSEPCMESYRERARSALPDAPERESFDQRFDLITLSRNAKDHARFLSAAERQGAEAQLQFLGAALHHLRDAATRAAQRDPALEPFAELLHGFEDTPCAQ